MLHHCSPFWVTFAIKLMEREEEDVEVNYARGQETIDGAYAILQDERHKEKEFTKDLWKRLESTLAWQQ